MIVPDYYYVIVGGGLAGLQLALRLQEDLFFKGKKIAIIDPSDKAENDKTWCFWEKGSGDWDALIHQKWSKARFISENVQKKLDLQPYNYKMLRSLDFYKDASEKLEKTSEIYFITDEILKIDPVTRTAIGKNNTYTATHFFDSRPPQNLKISNKINLIFQHFKGWSIKTEDAFFEPSEFTMMDYRIRHEDSTSFIYVLPITATKALVEFTFFTPFISEKDIYDEYLEKYISEILKIKKYQVEETEYGVIPMTDYPFQKDHSKHVTKIGTAGGWVKASSGYSFKNTEKKTKQIIENIKKGVNLTTDLYDKKFQFYDKIFLDVLSKRNDLGAQLFEKFYTKNSIQEIFRFLDEETGLSEDIKIMFSLYHPQFVKSFFNKL
ncbi:lycopene cyclase family protein [Gramella sp. AN32]|uniref:Lycopene cyclase family protein n=1 Tax=Christiangramia antarctica TaxID=2058158 RepID=A0ABW5X4V8_9FLAO|nr:lycopene cyclase family protein [Gramella sp. AN32]MCM4157650.1 lycopene cyclase [Gramella sp. AN32]